MKGGTRLAHVAAAEGWFYHLISEGRTDGRFNTCCFPEGMRVRPQSGTQPAHKGAGEDRSQ